jgi:hypothetical protein
MLIAAKVSLPIRSGETLKRRVVGDFEVYRRRLREDLHFTCVSVALSLDVWTSENEMPILGVLGHWETADFVYREELLESRGKNGEHSEENLVAIVHELLIDLDLEQKLLTITGDNAGNTGTLCESLYKSLLKKYDNIQNDLTILPIMRFHGRASYIRCLAHVLNLICSEVLRGVKAGNDNEARDLLDEMEAKRKDISIRIFAQKEQSQRSDY